MSRGESQSAVDNISSDAITLISRQQSILLLCDICHWCTTYLDKARLPTDNKCQQYSNIEMLSSFHVLPNELFTFDYNEKRGVELELSLGKQ
jgi:hypothetical protein